jgi:hypothetical protein
MTKYFAIFPDGTKLTRKSDREYGAAYLIQYVARSWADDVTEEPRTISGFARTEELAVAAANTTAKKLRTYPRIVSIDFVGITATQQE